MALHDRRAGQCSLKEPSISDTKSVEGADGVGDVVMMSVTRSVSGVAAPSWADIFSHRGPTVFFARLEGWLPYVERGLQVIFNQMGQRLLVESSHYC